MRLLIWKIFNISKILMLREEKNLFIKIFNLINLSSQRWTLANNH